MPLKEQLIQAIETLPSNRLSEALTLIQSLQTEPSPTTAQSFLTHLKTIGTWSGDDLQDCLEAIQNSRGEAQFDYSPNPFESCFSLTPTTVAVPSWATLKYSIALQTLGIY